MASSKMLVVTVLSLCLWHGGKAASLPDFSFSYDEPTQTSPAASLSTWPEQTPRNTSLTSSSVDILLSPVDSLLTPAADWNSEALTASQPGAPPSSSQNPVQTVLRSSSQNGSNCYFPSEYQGIYQVQSSIDPQGRVQYDQVEIGPQDISVWGTCHSLIGQHVILHLGGEAGDCFRCVHISVRTPTVLQVFPEGLQDKCYTNEEAARSKCPSLATIKPGNGIFLWRKSGSIEPTGQNIYRSLCPLDGEFTFKYYLNGRPLCETGNIPVNIVDSAGGNWDGRSPENSTGVINKRSLEQQYDYEQPLSVISTCPSRDILHATFRTCEITDRETSFKCLGTWPGENGQSYIGLMDFYDDSYAKFRCALFKEEKQDAIVGGVLTTTSVYHVSLSPDSSCNNELFNATYGYETLALYPVQKFNKRRVKAKIWDLKRKMAVENAVTSGMDDKGIPNKPLGRLLFAGGKNPSFARPLKSGFDGTEENATCRLPDWMQGDWQYFSVVADDLVMRNAPETLPDGGTTNTQIQTGKQQFLCLGRDVKNPGQDEKILLYSQTTCGEESVSCLWVRKKGGGMMEFRRGQPIPFLDATLLKRHTGAVTETSMPTPSFPPFDICEDSFFHNSPWITQMSLKPAETVDVKLSTCPFLGELEAALGSGDRCTAFSSHCNTPDVFEYKLRTCKAASTRELITYDERHYRCVSTWKDKEYTLFLTEHLTGEALQVVTNSGDQFQSNRSAPPSSSLQTQCFVMKFFPESSAYLVASLGSNCKHVSMGDPAWEDYLKQNGLQFKITANCSSSSPSANNLSNYIVSNEIPSANYHPPKLRPPAGVFNESDENFNGIYYAEVTSKRNGSRSLTATYSSLWHSFLFLMSVICTCTIILL